MIELPQETEIIQNVLNVRLECSVLFIVVLLYQPSQFLLKCLFKVEKSDSA